MGQVIRQDLISNKNNYSPLAIAQAFSLDRLVLYSKIHIPLLKENKIIIQDRGVTTSLVYQPIHNPNITIEYLSKLPGNKLALDNAPDYLFIVDVDPKEAIKRLDNRSNKQDEAVFEKLESLEKMSDKFKSDDFKKLMEKHKTKLIYLNGNQKIDIMKQEATQKLIQLLTK